MPRLGPTVRWVVRVGISLAIVLLVLRKVDVAELWTALAGVRLPLLALAALLYLAGQWLSGVKWWMIGRSVGLGRPLRSYVRFYFIGMFFNLFGPSTVGGDVARALYLGDGRRPGLALNSVLFDRVSGLAVLMAVSSVGLLLSPQFFPRGLSMLVVAGGLALLLGWWTLPTLVCLLPGHNRLRRQVEGELAPFWRDPRLLSRVALVSACFHLSQVVLQYVLVQAAGADVSLRYCLVFHPLLILLTALPISVSGFGVREASYLFFLGRAGVPQPIAIGVGLLWWSITAVGALAGGAIFAAGGARLPRLRRSFAEQLDPGVLDAEAITTP